MAAFEVLALDTATPQIRAPGAGDTYTFPRAITPSGANVTPFTVSGYSLTGANAQSMFDLSGTWNTSGTPTALKLNITDTASNAASRLFDYQVGGSSRLWLRKDGILFLGNGSWISYAGSNTISFGGAGLAPGSARFQIQNEAISFSQEGSINWTNGNGFVSATTTLTLVQDAANTLAQRRTTNAQTFRIYNTFTDASNYERGKIAWSSNVLQIGTEKAGTGTARALELQTDGTTRATISATAFQCTFNGSNAVVVDGANGFVACRSTASNGFNLSFSQLALGEQTPILFRAVPNGSNYTGLFSVAAGALEQRNGTNAQTFQIYNTFTDASNYERGKLEWASNVLRIGTEKAGTGTARAVDLQTDGTTRVTLGASGGITLADANDVAVGSTTGTKIGTATTQKLGFWNAAPIVQPTTTVAAATVAATGVGDVVAASTTFDGYTIPQIVKALRNAGLLA